MKIVKLLSDWLLIEEEPARERTSGGIILVNPDHEPIRIGKVLQAGSGRRYTDKTIPMPEDIVGQRVVFMAGASDTLQGKQLSEELPDNQRLIRLGDVLGIADGEVEIYK